MADKGKKIFEEIRAAEIAKLSLRVNAQLQKLRKGELKDLKDISDLKEAQVKLTQLEKDAQGGVNKKTKEWFEEFKSNHEKVGGILSNIFARIKKEIDPLEQIKFMWERVKTSAEVYAKVQGSLPALTGKQTSEIEKLTAKISQQGLSAKSAWDTLTSIPDIFKDAAAAAKTLAYQQFLMAENTRETANRYGETYEKVRELQKQIQLTTAIRVVDDKSRKYVEDLTDSVLYLNSRMILTTEEALPAVTSLSRQFGSGTLAAVKRASDSLERLSRIPDKLSDNMEKAEGAVGRFAATNREDFLRTVMELNKAYGSQTTILKNVGASFATLTMEARKYGAQAETADRVARGLSSALVANQDNTYISFLAGEKLAAQLQSSPALFNEVTAGMDEATKATVRTLMDQGQLGYSYLSNILASTTKDMENRINVIKELTGGQDLATTAELLSAIPELKLTTVPEKLTAARMLSEGKSAAELVKAIKSMAGAYDKDNAITRKGEEATLKGVNTIAKPMQAAENTFKGMKEAGMRDVAGAVVPSLLAPDDPLRKVVDTIAHGVTIISGIAQSANKLILAPIAAKVAAAEKLVASAKAAADAAKATAAAKVAATAQKAGSFVAKTFSAASKVGKGIDTVGKIIPGYGMTKFAVKNAPIIGPTISFAAGGGGEAIKQLADEKFQGKELDVNKFNKNLVRGTASIVTMDSLNEWLAEKFTSLHSGFTGLTEEQSREITHQYASSDAVANFVDAVAARMGEVLTPSATSMMNITPGTSGVPGAAPSNAPIMQAPQAESIELNADGSATIRTIFQLVVPGFSTTVAQANAQVDASKANGG